MRFQFSILLFVGILLVVFAVMSLPKIENTKVVEIKNNEFTNASPLSGNYSIRSLLQSSTSISCDFSGQYAEMAYYGRVLVSGNKFYYESTHKSWRYITTRITGIDSDVYGWSSISEDAAWQMKRNDFFNKKYSSFQTSISWFLDNSIQVACIKKNLADSEFMKPIGKNIVRF